MPSHFFDNPGLFRTAMEELPVGIYMVDREQRIRFWNRGAEAIIGYLAHEVVGRLCSESIACDQQGHTLCGKDCPVTATLRDGQRQSITAFCLHKLGHRVPVHIRTQAILRSGEAVDGAIVLFEEAKECRDAPVEPSAYGCLDPVTGVPSQRLTRALLGECIAAMQESGHPFGVLRIRVLGLDEFRSQHGLQSAIPFLQSAARTLRHCLDPDSFLGRWGEDEFIVLLTSANPLTTAKTAELMWTLVTHSKVRWWGDSFPVQAVVTRTMAQPGDKLEKLMNGLEPAHAAAAGRAVGATSRGV